MAILGGLVVALAVAAGAVALISFIFRVDVDPREPPIFYPKVPLIGHFIGMMREGPLYLVRISTKTSAPIFTLPMLQSRMYICRSPDLAASIQRASANLDFAELINQMAPRLFMLNKQTGDILRNPTAAAGRALMERGYDVIKPPLSPKNLDELTSIQLATFNASLNSIRNGQEVDLFRFITNEVLSASMITFWGPKHPFVFDPELVECFWTWEKDITAFLAGALSPIIARKAYRAFQKLTSAFVEYHKQGHVEFASKLIQERHRLHVETGVPLIDCARLEIGLAFAFNANAGIIAFWVLNNIFSRPELLAEIREEVEKNAITESGTITFASLKEACPLLNSVYRESMRFSAPMTSSRWVKQDTVIADTYLVRKDTVIQVAGGIMHFDPEIWGPDVLDFNPRRFLYSQTGQKTVIDADAKHDVGNDKERQVHAAAFRSFGGGSSLCPGRHFAQMEVLCLVAVLACGFEMDAPVGKKRVDWDPEKDEKKFPFAVVKPMRGIDVKLRRREGKENIKWTLKMR